MPLFRCGVKVVKSEARTMLKSGILFCNEAPIHCANSSREHYFWNDCKRKIFNNRNVTFIANNYLSNVYNIPVVQINMCYSQVKMAETQM
jgi:hypothetical protein